MNKILIFRTGSIGDNVCALPAIYSIINNFSKAEVHILYHAGGNSLVSIEKLINPKPIARFINYSETSIKYLHNKLKKERYDLWIEIPQVHVPLLSQLRNMVFVRSLGIKRAFGWQITSNRVFPRAQEKSIQFQSVRNYFLKSLEEHQLVTYPDNYSLLNISTIDKQLVKEKLTKQGVFNFDKLIAIVVGAKRPQNRWPIEYFNTLIEKLNNKGYIALIIGGKEDQSLVSKLNKNLRIINFTGKLTPVQSAAAFSYCRLTITNDTGPMHLSYAAGTFTIVMFSSRDYPELWYPPKHLGTVFRNDEVFCSACFSETCENNICMQGIQPSIVYQKAMDYLNES